MFVPRVITLYVGGELPPPTEAFAADFAHMRLFARVDAHVSGEILTETEGLMAYSTHM